MKIVQEVEHMTYCKSYLKVQSFGFTKCKTAELLTVSGSYKQSHRNKKPVPGKTSLVSCKHQFPIMPFFCCIKFTLFRQSANYWTTPARITPDSLLCLQAKSLKSTKHYSSAKHKLLALTPAKFHETDSFCSTRSKLSF